MLSEFYSTEKVEDLLKLDLNNELIDLLVSVSQVLTDEDKAEKVLPIILEIVRDDGDEEKRIIGLDLIDRIAEYIGKDIC